MPINNVTSANAGGVSFRSANYTYRYISRLARTSRVLFSVALRSLYLGAAERGNLRSLRTSPVGLLNLALSNPRGTRREERGASCNVSGKKLVRKSANFDEIQAGAATAVGAWKRKNSNGCCSTWDNFFYFSCCGNNPTGSLLHRYQTREFRLRLLIPWLSFRKNV